MSEVGARDITQTKLQKTRILAVDDEQEILDTYKLVLMDEGESQEQDAEMANLEAKLFENPGNIPNESISYDLTFCKQGDQAVEAVRSALEAEDPYAMVFMDVRMPPGIDGITAAEQIRALDPSIQIIIVTAFSDVPPDEIARRVRPRDKLFYMRKPFYREEIQQFGLALSAKWKAERTIKHTNKLLEQRVSERTAALYRANQQLLEQIKEKKRTEEELQQSIEKYQKAMTGIIQAMAVTVEMRDPYTAGHQKRVSELAEAIGIEMRLAKDRIDGIRMAGIIHDLGKISVPAEILSKPGQINEVVFNLIKYHPQVGFEILKTVDFPWPVASIVLQHHERMDGSGYPKGLSGDEILLESRIVAVADVMEAVASHRPYRPALGIDHAIEEVLKGRGILFDTDVVDACMRLFREKRFAFDFSETVNEVDLVKNIM